MLGSPSIHPTSQHNHSMLLNKPSFLLNYLNDVQSRLCEGELTLAKCKAALDSMATGKSPGVDGLPTEFYQQFWPVLDQDYVDMIKFLLYCWKIIPISALWDDHPFVYTWRPTGYEKLATDQSALCQLQNRSQSNCQSLTFCPSIFNPH